MQRHIITPINPRDATQTNQVSCEPATASKAGNPIEDTPMITVFREAQSQPADIVEAELRDMVISFERVTLTPEEVPARLGADVDLPAIQDGARIISGTAELRTYLKELADFYHDWHMYQGDACYVYDNGQSC